MLSACISKNSDTQMKKEAEGLKTDRGETDVKFLCTVYNILNFTMKQIADKE